MRALTLSLLLILSASVCAADLAREGRLWRLIEPTINEGKPLELNTGGHSFRGIYTPSTLPTRKGAVVVLHDMIDNPDHADVIQPLRKGLPRRGWDTLSIQMPLAPADAPAGEYIALIPEALPRIQAALDHLGGQGVETLVLVGHGLGARSALAYLAANATSPVKAAVLIGLGVEADGREALQTQLKAVRLPLLDLFGNRDLPDVLASRDAKAIAASGTGNRYYRQMEIVGADHRFRGVSNTLTPRIATWLDKAATQPPLDGAAPAAQQ